MLTNSSSSVNVTAIQSQKYGTGLNILVFYDTLTFYHDNYEGLIANYTAAGNSVTVVNTLTWDFAVNDLSPYDVLFMSVWGSVIIIIRVIQK